MPGEALQAADQFASRAQSTRPGSVMASVTLTTPVEVVKVVSSTLVSG